MESYIVINNNSDCEIKSTMVNGVLVIDIVKDQDEDQDK